MSVPFRQKWYRWIWVWGEQPSATSFVSLIILVWWTGISSSAVSPGIVPYPLERDDGGIQFIRHFKVILDQIQSTWSFHSRWSHISHSSSISMGFDYLLQSPYSVLLFHYLVKTFILVAKPIVVKQRRHWCKQFIMVHA